MGMGEGGEEEGKGKLGANAMKRVAAGAHLPTPWIFEPAKPPDDRADYCLQGKRKFGANAMKRVAAGAHLPTPWLFVPGEEG